MGDNNKVSVINGKGNEGGGGDMTSSSNYIRIKFVDQDNKDTHFKVYKDAMLGRAFESYSRFHKLDYTPHFTFNGQRVNPTFTAHQLNVEDGDTLDVHKHVHGGAA